MTDQLATDIIYTGEIEASLEGLLGMADWHVEEGGPTANELLGEAMEKVFALIEKGIVTQILDCPFPQHGRVKRLADNNVPGARDLTEGFKNLVEAGEFSTDIPEEIFDLVVASCLITAQDSAMMRMSLLVSLFVSEEETETLRLMSNEPTSSFVWLSNHGTPMTRGEYENFEAKYHTPVMNFVRRGGCDFLSAFYIGDDGVDIEAVIEELHSIDTVEDLFGQN